MLSRQLVPLALALWALGCGSGTSLGPQDGPSAGTDSSAGGTGGTPMGTGGGTGGTPMGPDGGGGSGADSGTCGPVCALYCPNGNVLHSRGCPTCSCKTPSLDARGPNGVTTLKDESCGTQ